MYNLRYQSKRNWPVEKKWNKPRVEKILNDSSKPVVCVVPFDYASTQEFESIVQSSLVILTSIISNNRLSRTENLVLVLT